MPSAPPTLCRCGSPRAAGQPCPRCGGGRRQQDRARGTRTQRGYDNAWLRFSAAYLRANPLCVFCLERGITTAATEVHHRVKLRERSDLKFEPSNLAAACKPCHSQLTSKGQ